MSRRSSRSSNLSQLYSTANPVSADISLVFADSIQIGTSPGVAAATLPRLSVLQAKNSFVGRDTPERDITKDNSSPRLVPRSNRSLLSNMYLSKWRQHPTAIPRTERVIQPEACSSPELSHVPPSDHRSNNTLKDTYIPDSCLNPSHLPSNPMTRSTSPSPQVSKLEAKSENSTALGSSPGTDSAGPIFDKMCLKDAEESRVVPMNNLVSKNPGPDHPECLDIPASKTVEPEKLTADPTNDVLQSSDSRPDQTHANRILSGESSIVDPVIESDSSSFRLYVPSSLLPRQFFPSAPKKELQHIDDLAKEVTSPSIYNDNTGAALEVPSERPQGGIPVKTSPIEKPSSSPPSAWSDYLRFSTATAPKSRPSTSDSIPPLTSPQSKDYSDLQVISHARPSSTSDHTWFAPWTWWHSSSGVNLSSESIAVPTNPEGDVRDSQIQYIGTKSLFISPELASPVPINADRETRGGWLSVLMTTHARQRALKEEGETMEVMTVSEELSSIKPAISEDINIQSESRSAASISKPVISKDSTFTSSSKKSPPTPHLPNLVLPTFEDAFCGPPRSNPLPKEESTLHRTVNYMAKMLFPDDATVKEKGKGKGKEPFGRELPKTWSVLGEEPKKVLGKIKRVVVIGIHGWFPRAFVRQVLGEPTGTSEKFATMLERTVEEFFAEYGVTLDKITKIVLQGEGTVAQRVNNLFQEYLNHEDWVNDLQTADAVLFGTHSQGSIVTTELVNRLINEGHIRTPHSSLLSTVSTPQRIGVLALCGVHNGPLVYLNTSSFVNPYIQYFESAAARELFEYQDSESPASRNYIAALSNCLNHGVKFTYIASLDDQVVPIYSGIFVNATHPLILRALYIDGDAYHSSDFLSNLLVLLLKIRNTGLHDSGLIAHLSEATAGSLTGLGHSTAYEEPASYKLAVRFLFETSDMIGSNHDLIIEPFTARAARNDYEIPWALRDLIANPDVAALFASEFSSLRSAFDDWHPRTTVLRDIRRKLEPIRRLNTSKL